MTALREIRILQLLNHENIVNLIEICRTKSEFVVYIALCCVRENSFSLPLLFSSLSLSLSLSPLLTYTKFNRHTIQS